MGQTVQKWGNSFVVRIPEALAHELQFQEGTEVELSSEAGALVVALPGRRARRKYDLDEMISRITDENMHGPND